MIRWSSWNVYEQNKLGRNIKYNKSMKILKSLVKNDSSKMDLLSVNIETKNFLTIQGYEGIWKTNNRGKNHYFYLVFLLSSLLLITVNVSADIYKHVICTLRTQAKLTFGHTYKKNMFVFESAYDLLCTGGTEAGGPVSSLVSLQILV